LGEEFHEESRGHAVGAGGVKSREVGGFEQAYFPWFSAEVCDIHEEYDVGRGSPDGSKPVFRDGFADEGGKSIGLLQGGGDAGAEGVVCAKDIADAHDGDPAFEAVSEVGFPVHGVSSARPWAMAVYDAGRPETRRRRAGKRGES